MVTASTSQVGVLSNTGSLARYIAKQDMSDCRNGIKTLLKASKEPTADMPMLYLCCRPNHGLMTMYEFGETIGGLERCYYFGHGKDLYHFDHFMGTQYPG